MQILIKNFQKYYKLDGEICIDERLIKAKGRFSYKQYMPDKKSKYGVKIFSLAESKSGYNYNLYIYTGKNLVLPI